MIRVLVYEAFGESDTSDVKQKNGERRTRRALGDIGNLVPARTGVETGKPLNRPITRNFKAQMVTNAHKPKAEVGEATLKNLTLDPVKRRSIKPPKSLTTVLSARSKVMLFSFGVDIVEDFKEYMLRDYCCWLKT
nr:hypothetical protein [Tanacetum cinerariifolium]